MKSSYYTELRFTNASSISHRTRICFILLCLIANLSRTVSIIILDVMWPIMSEYRSFLGDEINIEEWYQNLLRTLPSLIYISSYSVVVLFWAHVYYSSMLINTPYMISFFIATNSIMYGLYIIGLITSLLSNLLSFITFSLFLLSITYTFSSISLLYFGIKVVTHLTRRAASGTILRYNVIQRVLFLTIFCPVLLFTRGIISGIQCIYSFLGIPTQNNILEKTPTGDTLIFILTELFPSIIIVISFWQKLSPSNSTISTRGLGYTSGIFSNNTNDNYFTRNSFPLIQNINAINNLELKGKRSKGIHD
ncbi:putative membrane protein [Cryptosporidium felis]|nr:putative membrane protein [Cryptosporidium felis]